MSDAPISKSAFAVWMGVDKSQPTRWAKLGMPTLADGKIDPVAAAAWVRANIDPTQRESRGVAAGKTDRSARAAAPDSALHLLKERVRVTRAQADEQEMKNDVRRGEVVEISDVVALVGQEYAKVRTRLLAIPAQHAPQLARLKSPAQMQQALGDLITVALEELTQDVAPESAPASRLGTLAEERTRVAHAQANALERNNRVQEGALIERAAAEAVFFEEARAARDAWLNWPVVTGPLLATDLGVDAAKVTRLLVEHVHRQLAALGEPQPEFAQGADA